MIANMAVSLISAIAIAIALYYTVKTLIDVRLIRKMNKIEEKHGEDLKRYMSVRMVVVDDKVEEIYHKGEAYYAKLLDLALDKKHFD